MLHCLVLQEEVDEGGGGQRGQNLLLPVPYSPISRTFISRLPPYLVLLPSPINLETQNTSLKESKFVTGLHGLLVWFWRSPCVIAYPLEIYLFSTTLSEVSNKWFSAKADFVLDSIVPSQGRSYLYANTQLRT